MTLPEVHADPAALARYLGVPFEDQTETYRPTYGYPYCGTAGGIRPLTAEERVARAYAHYRAALEAEWARSPQNPYRGQTWGQFLAECLREGLGIKSKGKLSERLDYARMANPHLYPT